MIKLLGEAFEKTNNLILLKGTHKFIIELFFSSMIDNKKFILENKENIKNVLKISNSVKKNKDKGDLNDQIDLFNFIDDKDYINLKEIIEIFYKYVSKFTTDVTAGKKIWKEVEEYVTNNIGIAENSGVLLEIAIIYIFNKSRNSGKVILSSIFEFLCDQFNSSNHVEIPYEKENFNKVETDRQNLVLKNNLNMFYDIICNHYEIILTDQILNERYMLYFARIFIEDTLNEIMNETGESNEKFLIRLQEILSQASNPCKLIINLLSNVSKFFNNQLNVQYCNSDQQAINIQLLDRIYKKLIIFLYKFSSLQVKEHSTLDRDEFFNIINNFSTNAKALRPNYIMFFIKFFIFIESNFKLELEFIHRKKVYVIIFEIFYELIVNFNIYEDRVRLLDEYVKLIELLVVLMKTYSKTNLEDGYLIYKMAAMVVKKILLGSNGKLEVDPKELISSTLNFNKDNFINFQTIQLVMIYGLVNMVIYLITGFYQLTAAYSSIPKLHQELISQFEDVQDGHEIELISFLKNEFKLLDIHNLNSILFDFHNFLGSLNVNEPISYLNMDFVLKLLQLIINRYFSNTSPISVHIENEMVSRQLDNFIKEFNNEMTFRDFSKVIRKDSESLSEHNFSLISNRDIDNINDITIIFTEERKSDVYKDAFLNESNLKDDDKNSGQVEIIPRKKSFMESSHNLFSIASKMYFASEMDDYLTRSNAVNTIKL